MTALLGELLPLAVGIAISPVPVAAAILVLLGGRASSSWGFLLGWVLGIAVVVGVVAWLSSVLTPSGAADDGGSSVVAWLQLALGLLLLVVGVRTWRHRPREGEHPAEPSWLAALDGMGPARAAGLGALLAAVNPKNTTLGIGAGLAVGRSGVDLPAAAVAVAVFTLVAGSTVLLPTVASAVAADRMAPGLARLRAWLVDNNATVMAVLLTVMGSVLAGRGLESL